MSRVFHIQKNDFPFLYFITTSWNMGVALVPLLFIPLTETSGRMPGYFGAYIIFLIFFVPCEVARGFTTMVICRFFGGGASSVAINIVSGTISDVGKGPNNAVCQCPSRDLIGGWNCAGAFRWRGSHNPLIWILPISIGALL
jgi:hypothetical protein